MFKTTIMCLEYKDIKFGEIESTTEVIFHGRFTECNSINRLKSGGGVRYGEKNGKKFLAIDRHSALIESVYNMMNKYPDERIECDIIKNDNEFKGYVLYVDIQKDNYEWPSGVIVIKFE